MPTNPTSPIAIPMGKRMTIKASSKPMPSTPINNGSIAVSLNLFWNISYVLHHAMMQRLASGHDSNQLKQRHDGAQRQPQRQQKPAGPGNHIPGAGVELAYAVGMHGRRPQKPGQESVADHRGSSTQRGHDDADGF